jgi:hypothetical protein
MAEDEFTGGSERFPATRWSVIEGARISDGAERMQTPRRGQLNHSMPRHGCASYRDGRVIGKHYEEGHWLGSLQFISSQGEAFPRSE